MKPQFKLLLCVAVLCAMTPTSDLLCDEVQRCKAWVWANQPSANSYTPSADYQYNSSGGTNRVVRLGVGDYRVEFPGLGTASGVVHVSSYGGSHISKVVNWGPSATAQRVRVRCFSSTGVAVDGKFTVLFYKEDRGARWADAYLWANKPTAASYTPDNAYQWNSKGVSNTVGRMGRGQYEVKLPSLGGQRGTVLVTAYGSGSERAKVVNWKPMGNDMIINVHCFNSTGNLVDTRFTLSYMSDVALGARVSTDQHQGGYAWADQPTTTSYTPSLAYQLNTTGTTNTINRFSQGAYEVSFPSLAPSNRTIALVTAYGSNSEYCTVDHWDSDSERGTKVYVKGFNTSGGPIDTRFTIVYLTDDQPPNKMESLRIGTYNAQFLPWWPDTKFDPIPFDECRTCSGCCEDIPNRPEKLAERILASGYDIIALQEMFDDEPQEILAAELSAAYPYYIQFVDGSGSRLELDGGMVSCGMVVGRPCQDSGLMLFSRFPFVELPNTVHQIPEDRLIAYSAGIPWRHVAFTQFTRCYSDDCYSNKGAALVRVQNPNSNRFYTIVFTHLNAGSREQSVRTRGFQLNQIRDLIVETLGTSLLNSEDIFLMGDFNINGDIDIVRDILELRGEIVRDDRRQEYRSTFGAMGFTNCSSSGLHDAWECETQADDVPEQKRDRGLTSDLDGSFEERTQQRVDYIFRNNPPTPQNNMRLCVQHMTIAHNLRHGEPYTEGGLGLAGVNILSDHAGLNADINLWAPHCSSKEALPVGETEFDTHLNGTITHAGSMQWYRVDQAGTFSFALSGEGDLDIDFRIYESTNLSVPLSQYRDLTTEFTVGNKQTEGPTFAVLEPPFYVRVFSRDRTQIGDYTLIIHKHRGQSREDAIILYPNWPQDQVLPDLTIGAGFTTWFRIDTEGEDTGSCPQLLEFFVEYYTSPDAYRIELRRARSDGTLEEIHGSESSDVQCLGGGRLAPPRRPLPSGTFRADIWRNDRSDDWREIYMLVSPTSPLVPRLYSVGWTTDLVVLHTSADWPMKVQCSTQTDLVLGGDAFGEDDDAVKIQILINDYSLGRTRSFSVLGPELLGDFDTGQIISVPSSHPIRFLSNQTLTVDLDEYDSGSGNDHVKGFVPDASFGLVHRDIRNPLNPRRGDVRLHEMDCDECNGVYYFFFNLSHGLQALGRP